MLQKVEPHSRMSERRKAGPVRSERDDQMRGEFSRMVRSWTTLARSYELVQSPEAFLLEMDRRRSDDAPRS